MTKEGTKFFFTIQIPPEYAFLQRPEDRQYAKVETWGTSWWVPKSQETWLRNWEQKITDYKQQKRV